MPPPKIGGNGILPPRQGICDTRQGQAVQADNRKIDSGHTGSISHKPGAYDRKPCYGETGKDARPQRPAPMPVRDGPCRPVFTAGENDFFRPFPCRDHTRAPWRRGAALSLQADNGMAGASGIRHAVFITDPWHHACFPRRHPAETPPCADADGGRHTGRLCPPRTRPPRPRPGHARGGQQAAAGRDTGRGPRCGLCHRP
ncbi:hypothetical protein SXCC_02340 [Gluconacetobacter sp. SXCC-1]|nr:hypothetical protein SXCC_02340 [Gluconacetobacter sp. SXCC-1]